MATYLTDRLKPNTTLYFPVVQECEQGVSRWIDIPAAGQGGQSHDHGSKSPAPGLKLIAKTLTMRLAAGIAALLSVLCFATGAFAHATLVAAEPADGSVVAQAPKMVHLRFNEAVTPAVISLIDAEGKSRNDVTSRGGRSVCLHHAAGKSSAGHAGRQLSRRLAGRPSRRGIADVFGRRGNARRVSAGGRGPSRVDIWLVRIGVYLGLFVGVGGVFFAAWIGCGPDGGTTIKRALGVGLVSAVASLGLQGLELQNLPPGAWLTSAPWKAAFSTSFGPSMLIAIAAMVIAGFAWRSPTRTIAWTLSSIAMAGVGLSLAMSGHASTASPQWLSRPLVFVHGVGVAYWVGALAPLAAMARRRSSDLLRALRIFSAGAVCGRRAGGADRPHAGGHPTAKFSRAGRYQLWHHPAGQAGAGDRPARLCRAQPLFGDAGAGGKSGRHPSIVRIGSC